ncbi:ABC transporter substrate-binding protein [Mannheimia granulomatis]|uniref:ABC transporter substrate-binding protein n=1 Tax=Mannheimia granulomatis TaxID=85402 RepID=UPI00047CB9C6|nr:helical backbone metal receptor [Mannheimia granulomatis]QLB18476.1 helical backbone metal receptor [Mannheimia granulomatis]
MQKTAKILTALFLTATAQAEQFISLNLCSDRLLLELAEPQQIAAQSIYSNNPKMMLDKLNLDKPRLKPELPALLPYADKTILVNTLFYPELARRLSEFGFKVVPLNDNPKTAEELFALILQLGELTQNQAKAEALVAKLRLQKIPEKRPLAETVILSETGVADMHQPQYQTLLALLGLEPVKIPLPERNFSLEKLIQSQPHQLIQLTDNKSYNAQAEWLHHPILQKIFKSRPLVSLPMKYTYCFDHGVWQGAELIEQQFHRTSTP